MYQNTRALNLLLLLGILLISCVDEKQSQLETSQNFNPSFKKSPNILWLVAEDLSPMIPAFGDSTVITPNLSRLAAEGVRYTNLYSPSGVCAPSRLSIATGMYPSSLGGHHMRVQWNKAILDSLGLPLYEVVPPPQIRMMSEYLRKNGYFCTNNDKTDYQFVAPATAWDQSNAYAHWRKRARDQPFFSVFNFDITHESQVFSPTSKKNLRYNDSFPQDSQSNPVASWHEKIDSAAWHLHVPNDLYVTVPPYLPPTALVKNDIRRVYSNIVEMDRQVGLILKQLEDDGELENTIIVWYTDHGGPLPRQKRLLYDSGIKVPMIIRFPNQQYAGQIDDQLVSFIDLAPTTLTIAGISPPAYLQGRSFLGESQKPKRKYIHAAADRFDGQYDMIRAVRDKRYKYLKNYNPDQPYYLPIAYRENMNAMKELLRLRDAGKLDPVQLQWFRPTKPEEELFDCLNDPNELNNLAEDPAYLTKLEELRVECKRWMAAIDDKGNRTEIAIIKSFWPGLKQPTTASPKFQANGNEVFISSSTTGASIAYQVIDITESPTTTWQVYQKSIMKSPGKKIIAKAHRIGFKPSKEVKYE